MESVKDDSLGASVTPRRRAVSRVGLAEEDGFFFVCEDGLN